ncbi:hypothetical protein [Variovorax paradoxus]|uniref:hypothetical protein n=1 Tax=Variovorax paradoxus TaxID=34073 RepID=UPI0019327886|nr:hypothetical protein INQ48_30255 [Variovorax paradoxus]
MTHHHLLALSGLLFCHAALAGAADECFPSLPGREDIPFDAPGEVKITRLRISAQQELAYLATEYIGAKNLQATLYLKRPGGYCFSGDLGALTNFRVDRSTASHGRYGIVVLSGSGDSRFSRRFSYRKPSQKYELDACRVGTEGGRWRACTASEQ